MSKDRSIATDALEVLGTIIDGVNVGRDAIHLAVEPATAGETLAPGNNIRRDEDGLWVSCKREDRLAIADPFLADLVKKGQRFLAIVPPREITSLRHVWSHPAFPEDVVSEILDMSEKAVSARWIDAFAADLDQTTTSLMRAAQRWLESKEDGGWGDYTYDNSESYKPHWHRFPEFWTHYETVTGKPVEQGHRETFFTCSC